MQTTSVRSVSWPARRLARRLWSLTCSRLYRDDDRDPRHSTLIAGTARAGTTWLADVLASHHGGRMMFEPFHSRKVEAYGGFHYFQYMRPATEDDALHEYCHRVFTGAIRHPWIDREVSRLRPRGRIIKEIRANLMLKWIHDRFPGVPLLLIVRHPCAVVASRLALDWDTDADIESFLEQPALVEDHLRDQLATIERARTPEEKHAVIWCVSYLVPWRQFDADHLPVVFYENLCTHPGPELSRWAERAGLDPPGEALTKLAERPSSTAKRDSAVLTGEDPTARWRKQLSPKQITRVLDVVSAFGLDHVYGEQTMPRVGSIWG